MKKWHIEDSADLYNINGWGVSYFGINEKGHIMVTPKKNGIEIDLREVMDELALRDISAPVLLRFPDILDNRIESMSCCYKKAAAEYGFKAECFSVYPIKVNQMHPVVEEVISHGQKFNLGLEAGSKPELHAVIAVNAENDSLIICNGYKDESYIELALLAQKMGKRVYLVIEKMNELDLIAEISKRLNIRPKIGIRIKLGTSGSGKWEDSGGDASKFGLTSSELLEALNKLEEIGLADCLKLIHFHIGSQVTNIRHIKTAIREASQFYVQLHKMGFPVDFIDAGGGLGVDYEGTRSQSDGSVNYGLSEYANNIIWAIGDACRENGLKEPTVITESGRATTAYHTVLVSNVIGVERVNELCAPQEPAPDAPRPLQSMWRTWQLMHEPKQHRSLREWLHDSQMDLNDIHHGFLVGEYSLHERASAEQMYLRICAELKRMLDPLNKSHRVLIDELEERMADKLYVNFSLFQSLPDAWGIGQLFPVMPLEFLDKPMTRRAVLLDITCDSDGSIDQYMDGDDIASTMPFPEYDQDNPPYIGFFMVGAYQEILGNMHNLLGDTEAVDVYVHEGGPGEKPRVQVRLSDEGDTVADMLQYVQLDPSKLLNEFTRQVRESDVDETTQRRLIDDFKTGLYGYTYLEEDQI